MEKQIVADNLIVFKDCFIPCLCLEHEETSVGFRIAQLLSLFGGANEVENLAYYSPHVLDRKDESSEYFRGAYGPRMMFWVGADQLAAANRKNVDVDDETQFSRPEGVCQIKQNYLDLTFHGFPTTSFIVRNPSVDFDESNDIPDLLCGTFNNYGGKLGLTLFFEITEDITNIVWTFSKLVAVMAPWMELEPGNLQLVTTCDVMDVETIDIINESRREVEKIVEISIEPQDFWADIEELRYLEMNMRQLFNEKSMEAVDVSYEKCIAMVNNMINGNEYKPSKFFTDYVKDLARALMIWIMINKCDGYGESHIMRWLQIMTTNIRYEVAYMLKEKSTVGLDVLEVVNEILENGE